MNFVIGVPGQYNFSNIFKTKSNINSEFGWLLDSPIKVKSWNEELATTKLVHGKQGNSWNYLLGIKDRNGSIRFNVESISTAGPTYTFECADLVTEQSLIVSFSLLLESLRADSPTRYVPNYQSLRARPNSTANCNSTLTFAPWQHDGGLVSLIHPNTVLSHEVSLYGSFGRTNKALQWDNVNPNYSVFSSLLDFFLFFFIHLLLSHFQLIFTLIANLKVYGINRFLTSHLPVPFLG